MSVDNKAIHFVAGAISGTAGSILTCPLDVAKTRLQSSLTGTYKPVIPQNCGPYKPFYNQNLRQRSRCLSTVTYSLQQQQRQQYQGSVGLIKCIRHIVAAEGYRALFKGLLPTLVGVAPSRAIYFTTYDHCKKLYSGWFNPATQAQFSLIHLMSAASAGFACTTATNPIWMIRTRLQLSNKSDASLTTFQCIRDIYKQLGIRGFYKGLVASYFGISETAIHFVIYEAMKAEIIASRNAKVASTPRRSKSFAGDSDSMGGVVDGEEDDVFDLDKEAMNSDVKAIEFLKYMGAAATSKTIATCIAYPHEVARTRLREENSRYKTFFGTLVSVFKEEGYRGLYRGMGTQLIKHIPNTAIVITVYEAVIYICHKNGF